jgi:hypothetical protein
MVPTGESMTLYIIVAAASGDKYVEPLEIISSTTKRKSTGAHL